MVLMQFDNRKERLVAWCISLPYEAIFFAFSAFKLLQNK